MPNNKYCIRFLEHQCIVNTSSKLEKAWERFVYPFFEIEMVINNDEIKGIYLDVDEDPKFISYCDRKSRYDLKFIKLHGSLIGEVISEEKNKILIFVRNLQVCYVVEHNNGDITHIKYVCGRFSEEMSLDLLRIVRGILIGLAQKKDGIKKVHMSIVAIESEAIAFVGGEGAGKTSFMLTFLKQFNNSFFVTNDKALLILSKEKDITVWGLPYAASIGFKTLDSHREIPFNEETRVIKDKAYYWPQELARYLNRSISSVAKLSSIIAVQIIPSSTQLDCLEVKFNKDKFILDNILSFSDTITPYWLLEFMNISPFMQESANKKWLDLLEQRYLYKIIGNPCNKNLRKIMKEYQLL